MTPGQRCDEIIRMIDEVLNAGPGTEVLTAEAAPNGSTA